METENKKLNFNDRERKRFISGLREIAGNATEAANALESGNDPEFMLKFLVTSFSLSILKEISDATSDAIVNQNPGAFDEFPEFIPDKE